MRTVKIIIQCSILAGFMYISLFVKADMPFTPVPATLQLAVCHLSGAFFGAYTGSAVMLMYVIAVIYGFPVFAEMNSGMNLLLAPSGGYLIGFIPSAFLTGKLIRCFYKPAGEFFIQYASIFISLAISTIMLYIFEALFFSVVMSSGFMKAAALSVMPFIWIDFVKIIVLALIIRQVFQIDAH